jgi:ABC-2 type transport system ATP-binding protein
VGHPVEPIIIERLVKSYNGTLAVRDLSFSVDPGRITGILGPNGAGKTTTLRILVGLAAATAGTATFGGIPYAQLEKPQRRVGAVLDASFHPGRTGRNHLRVLAATAGASDARVDELLDLVGLSDDGRRPAGQYSLGLRQRLALASALLGDPDYLILDEPANGRDPEGIRWLRHFLREFADSGRTVLVSSHLLNEVQATVDEVVVINKGRLLAQMPMSDLQLGQPTMRVRVSDLDAALTALAPLNARVERGQDAQGSYLRVHSHEDAAAGAALSGAGIVVNELIIERRDLEQELFSMPEGAR